MRFVNEAVNPDFFLFVRDLNTIDQRLLINGSRLNSGDMTGYAVTLTPDSTGTCLAQWTVQTEDGRQNTEQQTEGAAPANDQTVQVHL